MESLDHAGKHPQNQNPEQQKAINLAPQVLKDFNVVDPGPKFEAGLVNQEQNQQYKHYLKDQLILPETQIPQEVSDILQRAEQKGIRVFDAYHLSDVMLTQDTTVHGWDRKPEQWYWDNVGKGNISKDAPQLPSTWVLIDRTERPSYSNGRRLHDSKDAPQLPGSWFFRDRTEYSKGRQLHDNDPFGSLLAKLRKDKKIQTIRGIPETSRFGISPDELSQVVLPEIAKFLEVDKSQVRLPKEIEFNVLGNLVYPKWGDVDTSEWLDDKFGDGDSLMGGNSIDGGLADVDCNWSVGHFDTVAFRPLIVVSPKP